MLSVFSVKCKFEWRKSRRSSVINKGNVAKKLPQGILGLRASFYSDFLGKIAPLFVVVFILSYLLFLSSIPPFLLAPFSRTPPFSVAVCSLYSSRSPFWTFLFFTPFYVSLSFCPRPFFLATAVLHHIPVRVVTHSTSEAQSINPLASLLYLLMVIPISTVSLGKTKRDA